MQSAVKQSLTFCLSEIKKIFEKEVKMDDIKRDVNFHFRTTKNELDIIRENAKLAGLTNSEYVRRRALKIQVVAKVELNILSELKRLGGLIKHLYNESNGLYNTETAEALNALTLYIRTLERELS